MRMKKRKGSALVMTVILMSFLLTLALTLSQLSVAEIRHSDSQAMGEKAHDISESGLEFMTFLFRGSYLSSSTNESNILSRLSTELAANLNHQTKMAGTPSVVGSTVSVPAISLGGGSFTTTLTYINASPMELQMRVTGTFDGTSRTVQRTFRSSPITSGVFQFGIATPGTVSVKGNSTMAGLNASQNAAASILSCTTEPIAIEVGGHAEITGDLYVTGVDNINIKGGLSVGGETDIDIILNEHCHFSVDPPEWPEIDIQPFLDAMTNPITITPSTKSNDYPAEFTNVIIEPNTNPTISQSVVKGVLYIKAPNQVKFSGHVVIQGVIVTEDKPGTSLADCTIRFTGNADFPGVGALPDTAQYADLRELRGTTVLAPGFDLRFTGNSNTALGVIAADQLFFTGNSDVLNPELDLYGDMYGTVLSLTGAPLTLTGNTNLKFNRPADSAPPAGFIHPIQFVPVLGSYRDIAQ